MVARRVSRLPFGYWATVCCLNLGAVIIIDPAGTIRDGCYVMAEYKNEYIFRQLRIVDDKYYLQPLNDLYDTVEISGQDVIQGVITQKAGRRRKEHKHYGKD